MSIRGAVRELLPPAALRIARRWTHRDEIRFDGRHENWEVAQGASAGYGHVDILKKVYEAELEVKRGHAADARDGVLFDSIEFSLPVMAALARTACNRSAPLRVLDFGGAFGGMYRQYRAFGLRAKASWNVVEQPGFVALGREFETPELRFHASIEEVLAGGVPDVALFSSVLQYLPHPDAIIERIKAAGVSQVVIDRTPCFEGEEDLITIQHVPAQIYKASYPCRIFSRSRFMRYMEVDYKLVATFTDAGGPLRGPGIGFDLAGFIFDKRI